MLDDIPQRGHHNPTRPRSRGRGGYRGNNSMRNGPSRFQNNIPRPQTTNPGALNQAQPNENPRRQTSSAAPGQFASQFPLHGYRPFESLRYNTPGRPPNVQQPFHQCYSSYDANGLSSPMNDGFDDIYVRNQRHANGGMQTFYSPGQQYFANGLWQQGPFQPLNNQMQPQSTLNHPVDFYKHGLNPHPSGFMETHLQSHQQQDNQPPILRKQYPEHIKPSEKPDLPFRSLTPLEYEIVTKGYTDFQTFVCLHGLEKTHKDYTNAYEILAAYANHDYEKASKLIPTTLSELSGAKQSPHMLIINNHIYNGLTFESSHRTTTHNDTHSYRHTIVNRNQQRTVVRHDLVSSTDRVIVRNNHYYNGGSEDVPKDTVEELGEEIISPDESLNSNERFDNQRDLWRENPELALEMAGPYASKEVYAEALGVNIEELSLNHQPSKKVEGGDKLDLVVDLLAFESRVVELESEMGGVSFEPKGAESGEDEKDRMIGRSSTNELPLKTPPNPADVSSWLLSTHENSFEDLQEGD